MTDESPRPKRDESEKPAVSVVVCTYNPSDVVKRTLESLRFQSDDAPLYEVIIVDNASDGGFAKMLQDESDRFGFRLVTEPEKGLSAARNRGVESARADWILFIDDDAIAPTHWLAALWTALQAHPCDAVGGPVHGLWEKWPQRWLDVDHWRSLSLVSWGSTTRYLEYPEILLGCNVGFHRAALQRVEGFDLKLGRASGSLIGGEELDVERRISESGGRLLYVPDAYVFHVVPAARLTKAYFKARQRGGVHTWQYLHQISGNSAERQRTPGLRSYLRAAFRVVKTASSRLVFEWQLITETRRAMRTPRKDGKS